jgi:hypothetical protein
LKTIGEVAESRPDSSKKFKEVVDRHRLLGGELPFAVAHYGEGGLRVRG